MKRLLLFTLTLAMLTVANVQQVRAYSTVDLTDAGWTKVTDMTSMTLSEYYFMLIDAGSSQYSVSNARPGTDSKPTYQALQDPISDAGQVWKISKDDSGYYLQSLVDDWYFIGARTSGEGWTDHMAAESTNGNFTFAVTDGKFSITSVFANGLVGPWENADHVNLNFPLHWETLEDNFYEELACNKGAEHAPGFYIYAISRATYDNNRLSSSKLPNGWTKVTETDQLGKSGYYYTLLDISETGYESGLVMAGGTGRPNYQAMNISTDNKIQIWTMASKGDGYQMKNCSTNTYTVCWDGTDYNTGFTDDANNQYTEFRFAVNNGFWVISNVNSLERSLGRWTNSPYRPGTGEDIAANKADNEGKRQFLIYSIPSIAVVAQALPEGGAMTANQWYYIDVDDENVYNITATTFAAIVYTTDGTLTTNTAGAALPGETNVTLAAGRYYIKSSSVNNFALTLPKANATDMEQLADAIADAEAHTLGFDFKGDEHGTAVDEYAPYNNVKSLTLLAAAKAIDQNNPSAYYQYVIQELTAALNAAAWTANTSEVNAIAYGDLSQHETRDGRDFPWGWNGMDADSRIMGGSEGTDNAGLSATSTGKAMLLKYNAKYGEVAGYTMPLKADTYYKIEFKYCGWNNTPTTNVVLTGPNGAVVVTPASFRPETNNGHTDATHWYTYKGTFKTSADGNYVLALNKVETGQQQIAWGDMVLVRATAEDLPYTLETGAMNAGVAAAQQTAADTFEAEAGKTFENYEALLTAIEAAKTSKAEYVLINDRINLLKAQLGDIPVAEAEADAFVTNYANGVYENLGQVIPAYQAFVQKYWSTNTPGENADLTAFIINPSLDFGNATGWGDGGVDHGTIEWFNGNYDVFQTLTGLPTGTYKLQAQGFYRPGGNENASTAQNALLYGGTTTQPVVLIASEGKSEKDDDNGFTTTNTNSGSSVYVPNSQADAAKAFATGAYENEVTFVVNNGTVNIGFKKDTYIDNDWTCFDNFKLIYIATIAPALAEGQMSQTAKQAMLDAKATYNTTPSVENYNALLAKIDEAQQSIAVYEQIANTLAKLTENASQRGDIDEVTEKAMTFYTNYSAGQVNGEADASTGTYETLDDMIAQYRTDIANYWTAHAAGGKDLTAFIVNQGFEFGNIEGWNETHGGRWPDVGARDAHNETYEFSDSEGDYVFNSWNDGWGAITLDQALYGLPQGTYELTAVFAAEGFNNIEFIGTNIREDSTEDETADKFRPVDINQRADKKTGLTRTIEVFVTDGKLKINGNTWGFFKADNFRLVYKSATLSDLADEPMNRYEKNDYDAAKAAYVANPTQENLRELAACKIICENSIKAYKAALKTLNHVKDMMDHTNVYTYDAFFTIDDMYRKYGPEEGFYGFRTLEDDVAYDLERMFFGNGNYRDSNNENIPAVPFIASAWDCGHNGYAYVETGPGKEGTEPGSDYYGNTWSREGLDDGTNMLTPYLEYWRYGDQRLAPRVLTATVEGTPNAEYTVKMFVRVRTDVQYVEGDDSTKPHGMTIQIGDGAKFTPNWQYIDNEGTQYVLNNARQLWVCNLWLPAHQGDATNASYLLPTGNADAEGNFKIKFEIEEGSNVTWLSMKDVYVNYETEVPETELAALKAQIEYADAHKLGFDFKGDEHGTAADEYAPYNNVQQLMALKRAKQVYDSPQNVFLVRNVTKALKAVNYDDENMDDLHPVYNEATDLWTKNTEEMNGFYWKNDYTNSDVKHIEWYEYKDDCITPSGWDLVGRNDGFNTGIKKLGVNTEDTGMKALEDQTGLLTKYETDYGRQVGYTLPLKKGVKYIMTFKYAYMGEGTCTEPTDITLTVPAAGDSGDDTENSGLKVTTFTPEGQGTEDLGKWKMYRATFTPTIENEEHPGEPVNYLITFDKDNAHDPVPVMMGELTLVRYQDDVDVINGESKDFTYEYEPEFIGTNATVTRSFNAGAYNTLVLPFTLAGHELKEALGSNFDGKVYYYTGVGTTSGENRDYYQLKFEERTGGIFANVPVLFYSDDSNPVDNWNNKEFTNMVTRYVKNDLTVDTDVFDFVGTYKTQKVPEGGWYIKADNNFYKSTTNKQKGLANIQPTRGYFIPYNTDGEVILHAKIMGFDIDDEPTGIMAIEEDGSMHVTSGNIYSVDGRLVRQNAKTLEGLPRGTYIVDGKKYMIK